MIFKSPVILGLACASLLAGCVQDPFRYEDPNARTKGAAATGAVLGGLIGAKSGGSDRLARAVIGAAAGAAIGGAIGNSLDRQAAELRAQLSGNSTVTNNGGSLVVTMPQDILFATDSAILRPDLQGDLRAVAANLVRYPNSRVEVIGHTDSTGPAAHNQDLSERRARSVANVLMSGGVPSGRISTFGRGADQPIASNATPAGRQANRRVEIIIRPTS
ncbi:MAG: OmpA family protein [Gemmobacter sp.]|jgi:outer membrane protein OmpA-like peptidoglycan-associated protein|nr:OmpA family protein [Gemmobacter sp.]